MKEIAICTVKSSHARTCYRCGAKIPAGTECIKFVQKWLGKVSLTKIEYCCIKCEDDKHENI